MNKSKSVKSLLLCAILISTFLINVNAQSKPWIAPSGSKNLKNPVAITPDVLKDGQKMYISYCSPCHGKQGKGDGPAAAALIPKPADHTSAMMLNETDGSLFYKISEGRKPMPSFKATLNENQRWELVAFIRTLNKSKK